jgi:hypothetical protein
MNRLIATILCPWWIIYRQNKVIEQQNDEIKRLSDVLANPFLTGLQVAQQQLEIGLQGPMCEYMAAVLGGLVEGCPEVENYLELRMQTAKGFFVVIVTKPAGGLTPHQLRMQAEAERDRLIERLAALEEKS